MRIDKGPVTFSIVGAGERAECYLSALEKYYKNNYKVVAVADIDSEKREDFKKRFNIEEKNIFNGYEEFIKAERLSDVAIVATLDNQHLEPAIGCLEKGYDLILEKPIGFDLDETVRIGECARAHPDQLVAVCHVLRHTPFFTKIKEIIETNELGKIIDIQHNENVGYFHYAHSYVRGNWRNTDVASPFIVAKCCHDMDILLYLLKDKKCLNLSSMGSLKFFTHDHYDPKTMAPKCVDCPSEKECPYSCLKIYPNHMINTVPFKMDTPEITRDTFSKSPYGRCVFNCDNNVADHQVTIIEFEDGVHATFNTSAFTDKTTRTIKIMCEYGEIRATDETKTIEITKFGKESKTIVLPETTGGHGGGDEGFTRNFMESYLNNIPFDSTIDMSIESHVMAFAAEESRMEHGKKINVPEFWNEEIRKIL